jgi:hypothetical protein
VSDATLDSFITFGEMLRYLRRRARLTLRELGIAVSHPFGDLLRQYRARKAGLSQTRLAHLAGYDQAVLVRVSRTRRTFPAPPAASASCAC